MQNYIQAIQKMIANIQNVAISGDLQAHEAYALIKEAGLEEHLKEAISEIKGLAIDNLRNNFLEQNESTWKDNSFSYTIRNGSTRYYFTKVKEFKNAKKDLEHSEPYLRLKEVESKYKRAFLMKQKNQVMVESETGEIVDPSDVSVTYTPDTLTLKRI